MDGGGVFGPRTDRRVGLPPAGMEMLLEVAVWVRVWPLVDP